MIKFSQYKFTKNYWKSKHKSIDYVKSGVLTKNNKISREFIERYLKKMNNINSLLELGVGSGRNLSIFQEHLPQIKYFGNDITQNLLEYVGSIYPEVLKLTELKVEDTYEYLNTSKKVDVTFTHGHLMHLPDEIIDNVCKNIANKTNKYILIREAYINNPGAGFIRNIKYKKYRFDRDYTDKFSGFKLIDKLITEHPTKKWIRQGEYFFQKLAI